MAAATSFISLSLQPQPKALPVSSSLSPCTSTSTGGVQRRSLFASPSKSKKNPISIPHSAIPSSSSPSPSEPPKPQIELEFVGPKVGADGSFPVDRAWAISGEKLLRNIMLENKIELYAAYIIDGKDLLNERTDTEKQYLKKKPESWRLACQTIVGNKENAGKVVVQRMPQWKK